MVNYDKIDDELSRSIKEYNRYKSKVRYRIDKLKKLGVSKDYIKKCLSKDNLKKYGDMIESSFNSCLNLKKRKMILNSDYDKYNKLTIRGLYFRNKR